MVKASRPEPGRRVTRRYASSDASPAATTLTSSRGSTSTSTSGRGGRTGGRGVRGRGNGVSVHRRDVDGVIDAPSDHREGEARAEEESFDRAFAALAEEMERELVMEMSPSPAPARRARFVSGQEVDRFDRSLETDTDAVRADGLEGLPDASSFRAASRNARGAFIREFGGEAAARLAEDDDDDRVASASPVFNPARGARARHLARLGAEQTGVSDESDGCGYPDGEKKGDETRRSGGFKSLSAGAEDAVAWARWGGGRGITIVETDASASISASAAGLDWARSRRGRVGAPLDDELPRDGEDILEAWRRRRRREAMEKGDEASAAARAAAAVAALEGDVSTGEDPGDPGAAGRASSDRSRSPARTSARRGALASPRANRSSPVVSVGASSVAVQTDADGVDGDFFSGAGTPSRARRSLEFDPGARKKTVFGPRGDAETREQDRRERDDLDASARALSEALAASPASSPALASRSSRRDASAPGSASTSGATTPATPSPRPSPGRAGKDEKNFDARALQRAAESLDLAAAIDVTVGAALFDFDDDDAAAAPTPNASPADAPRDRDSGTDDSVSGGGHVSWSSGSSPSVTRAGLPPRPGPRRFAEGGGDADRERVSPSKPPRSAPAARRDRVDGGLSPIEAVAAEVPDRPPLRPVEAKAAPAEAKKELAPSADAKAAAAAAAAAAANPWLPLRVAPAAARAPRSSPPGSARSPGGRLGEEWALPEDEDDGLVVMLKARVANLEGQIARVLAESGAARRTSTDRSR